MKATFNRFLYKVIIYVQKEHITLTQIWTWRFSIIPKKEQEKKFYKAAIAREFTWLSITIRKNN